MKYFPGMLSTVTLVLLLLVAACAKETLTATEQEYKTFCVEHHGSWMYMNEMKDGKVVGPPCNGCMPDERNHICTLEEYRGLF